VAAKAKFWLTVDPGETTGYTVWRGKKQVFSGQLPMWEFIDVVERWCTTKRLPDEFGGTPGHHDAPLGAIICEDWALYPWKLTNHQMDWDKCRTARAIGALELLARIYGQPFILQPAAIKEAAQAAGAESLYLEPIHENRHANDSIQHGVYYLAMEEKAPC
jgi:hypothetical protein